LIVEDRFTPVQRGSKNTAVLLASLILHFLGMLGSVSDFVLHAAKQNGSANLAGISRCWCFPVFPWKRVHSLTLVATRQMQMTG
jgi:hypothetical protein